METLLVKVKLINFIKLICKYRIVFKSRVGEFEKVVI